VQNLVRVLLVVELASRGGVLLHASSTVEGGGAYAFFGASGAGKSTLARGFSALLSDEIACVDGEGRAHRAPFTGERMPPPQPFAAPVRALIAIERGSTLALRSIASSEAVRRVLQCVVHVSHDRALTQRLIENTVRLCERVPVLAARFPRLPEEHAQAVFGEWMAAIERCVI
jgi:ABC-type Mn2+/Zn2+ transport system ATPase subunit